MINTIYKINYNSALIFTAIHSGDKLSPLCEKNMKLNAKTRRLEEDPYTEEMAKLHSNHIIPQFSRFEIDLNRRRENAFYLVPDDCWGLDSRKQVPQPKQISEAYQLYDNFYETTQKHLQKISDKFGKFMILDIHSYNHQRLGVDMPFDDPQKNPDVIIGTSNMPPKWQPFILDLQAKMQEFKINGNPLDVRIDIKYPGGNFPRWVHRTFPETGCAVALEFKKIYMNEWTGKVDYEVLDSLKRLIVFCKPLMMDYFGV
ncbi:MAG: N-formylglutamate amidohydrolase [Candidatus Cloacimonadales bacterium]